MTVIYSEFKSPWWLPGGNLQTQLPVWIRWQFPVGEWVTIDTADADQLSATWHKASANLSKDLIIVTHGLEGSNRQHYISGAIDYFQSRGLAGETPDLLAWNLRGCGARDNKTHKLYFAGCVDDLDRVIHWAQAQGYQNLFLAGYSLGANVTLRWAGNQGAAALSRNVKAICTTSATLDLQSTVNKLDKWENIFYRLFFVTSMKWRLKKKAKLFPGQIDLSNLHKVTSFNTYDEFCSTPLNGFANQSDMYQASSAIYGLTNIQLPCLIVQATNDPFLARESIPVDLLQDHPWVTLEVCSSGGHVGFLSDSGEWYLDNRFLTFFESQTLV